MKRLSILSSIIIFFIFSYFLYVLYLDKQRLEDLQYRIDAYTDIKTRKQAFIKKYLEYLFNSEKAKVDTNRAECILSSVYQWGNYYKLDKDKIFRIIWVETGGTFNPNAKGKNGEIGLMQLLPSTAEMLAGDMEYDLFDINDNIHLGCKYLKILLKYSKDYNEAIAKYNAGRYWRNAGLEYAIKVALINYKGKS